MLSGVRCFKCLTQSFAKQARVVFKRNYCAFKINSGTGFLSGGVLKAVESVPRRGSVLGLSTSAKEEKVDDFYVGVDYEALTKGDEELSKRLRVLVLEVDVMRQEGMRVPSGLRTEEWAELLAMRSKSQRAKHLAFLCLKERQKAKDRKKKEEKRQQQAETLDRRDLEENDNGHITYGFRGSTIFLRVYDTKMDSQSNNRLVQSMLFGQELVLDCGYDEHMSPREAANCAKQLAILFSENRKSDEPFNVHFCNARPDSKVMTRLRRIVPTMYDPAFPMNVTPRSYLELFPKERLVYLTPHCRQDLTFSHDDVYIVGGMVDKVKQDPLSLAKAKQEGLRVARLPLDRHLSWNLGSKSLTINQVLCILLDLKSDPQDWQRALRHVPRRKLNEGEGPKERRTYGEYKRTTRVKSLFQE